MTRGDLEHRLVVGEGLERLDVWVAQQMDISRSQVKQLVDGGLVLVNGGKVKAGYRLKAGMKCLSPSRPCRRPQFGENIPLEIIYQDAHLAIVNKPKGLVVHPQRNWEGTLVNALLYHLDDLAGIGGKLRPGIVHRLDKDTSGLMIVAKHDEAHRYLAGQLKQRRIHRHYIA